MPIIALSLLNRKKIMKWIKENPKKSIAIALSLASVGVTYMMFGFDPALRLLSIITSLL